MKKKNQGITLVEVLVSIAILGTLVLLGRVGVQLVNNMLQASAMSKVQQEAQSILYSISKDVRNSTRIVSASSTTLVLNMINTSNGFDVTANPTLFDNINVSTLTYTFVADASGSHLLKTLRRNNVYVVQEKLLRNMLIPPDNTLFMFNVCSRAGLMYENCPLPGESGYPNVSEYYGVDIRFRMSPLFVKDSDVQYSAKEIRRGSAL